MRFEPDGANNLIYLGFAAIGSATASAVWQIRKFTYDGANNVTAMQWAGGSERFDQIWDNRAGLTYT